MTVVVCFTLAILLYVMLASGPVPDPMIFVTAGLLIAMGGWHVQTFIRTRMLKKQWKAQNAGAETEISTAFGPEPTAKLLNHPDFENMVPASVTDHTTKHLSETKLKSS